QRRQRLLQLRARAPERRGLLLQQLIAQHRLAGVDAEAPGEALGHAQGRHGANLAAHRGVASLAVDTRAVFAECSVMSLLASLYLAWTNWRQERDLRRLGWSGVYVGDYREPPSWAYTIGFDET